ncbi:TPA: hypothetical protein O9509_000355 [Staphylococcus aureus]|uniref:hypothetical protein n=1 Tax=Staphylococcus aureus TaxID=1280 RepID=UPI000CD1CF4F|nr:hypothetical protein [Staphylococcus aureus]HDD0322274.1 hypothetical protein [Staphylococcus aureus]HDD0463857.1 hypothetical protein [Staphylococcus aureus]HDD0466521.1 hypothetical protein [Staphylococcus aureus]HDL4507030.1 hypothetical protein [Staphylococcus aureus]
MEWVFISTNIVIFIACVYVMKRRIEVRKKIDKLKRDIKENEKALDNYKKENRPIEYIVELSDGVYLQEEHAGAFLETITRTTTSNVFDAKSYNDLLSAKIDAESLNGRVLKYKPNLEVVE